MSDPLGSFLEGLVGEPGGAGFYGGYGFRQGMQERKRRRATEEEDRTYERTRRLREGVGFGLEQRVREGQLAAQGREADEYTRRTATETDRIARIRQAAAAIRSNPAMAKDKHVAPLLLLPDEQLVQGVLALATNPQRIERPEGDSPSRAVTRQDLASVERQVDDTRADLARTERTMPQRPMFFMSPDHESQFRADSAAIGQRLGDLRSRTDSLSIVRDSLAAEVQGRRFQRPQQKTPADRWEELVRQGVPPEEATRRVKQEFRLP